MQVAADLKLFAYIASSCATGFRIRTFLLRSNGDSAVHVLCLWQAACESPNLGQQKTSMHPNSANSQRVHLICCMMQVSGVRSFLKGLIVVDDVAYFGIAPHAERQARAEPNMNGELAAVHLETKSLLFRQKVGDSVPTPSPVLAC